MSRGFRPNSGSSSSPRPLLKDQLNPAHPLVKLSQAIDWDNFELEFGKQTTSEGGRPALPTRLMVGLHYLKALYDESDESVVNKWVENPYWQYVRHDTLNSILGSAKRTLGRRCLSEPIYLEPKGKGESSILVKR